MAGIFSRITLENYFLGCKVVTKRVDATARWDLVVIRLQAVFTSRNSAIIKAAPSPYI
jgi:hypothetical protein